MELYSCEADYVNTLKTRADLPDGFRTATASLKFLPAEKPAGELYPMNLSLILLEKPTAAFAGVFTRNSFPGAPIHLARRRMLGAETQGVLINNKVSNVCAPGGLADAEEILASLSGDLAARTEAVPGLKGINPSRLFMASTGIIGWRLPVEEIKNNLPRLAASAADGGSSARSCFDASRAVMTTDSFPKIRKAAVGGGSIVAFAKGAGMIEPNLATMLVFIMTDLTLPRDLMQKVLAETVRDTFNTISIDSDQSTSDMVLFFSSCMKPQPQESAFRQGLLSVCRDLADDIVRNGEGTGHVIKVSVNGAPSSEAALGAGKAVINSPLVKTAIFGNDPNVGRIIGALGDYAGSGGLELDRDRVVIRLGEEIIFRQGEFALDAEKEKQLAAYLKHAAFNPEIKGFPQHDRSVRITLDLNMGAFSAAVTGSDLSYEYVRENADYRS
ncbi:MAG: bifunctional ornithine acetyltransferase/N-acetylglutamate synthase [Spirochaetales bacterium]|nr:MAG: bifunctional ornithine acetyltransferase/N-acetylglutamate synthase [Spirochaetales bacterium]